MEEDGKQTLKSEGTWALVESEAWTLENEKASSRSDVFQNPRPAFYKLSFFIFQNLCRGGLGLGLGTGSQVWKLTTSKLWKVERRGLRDSAGRELWKRPTRKF